MTANLKRHIFGRTAAHAANKRYVIAGVSCFADTFVVNQTLVFQIKFCGKIPALRVAACLVSRNQKIRSHLPAKINDLKELKKSVLRKAFLGQLTMDNGQLTIESEVNNSPLSNVNYPLK